MARFSQRTHETGVTQLHQLRRKYLWLHRKYDALVQKFELTGRMRSGMHALLWWAMRSADTGIAMVDHRATTIANEQFHRLNRVVPGQAAWRRIGGERGEAHATLTEIIADDVDHMLSEGGDGRRVVRAERCDGSLTIDLHLERTTTPETREPRVAILVHDVTESVRRDRELAAAHLLLERQQHMTEMGQLAAGVAHDLKNLLHVVSLYAESGMFDRQRLAKVLAHGNDMVERIQDFARHERQPPVPVDLNAVIRESIELCETTIRQAAFDRAVEIRVQPHLSDIPPILADAGELRRVFANLVLNACDAMPRGGVIRVSTRAHGEAVEARVEDDGDGIPDDKLERIFDPFYTTKGELGTGLGLTVARKVVMAYGGTIRAAHADGGGAAFVITFPKLAGHEFVRHDGEKYMHAPIGAREDEDVCIRRER